MEQGGGDKNRRGSSVSELTLPITEIRVFIPDGKRYGIADIVLSGCFKITRIFVRENREGGYIVNMPKIHTPRGEVKDACHPITSRLREDIEDAVIWEFIRVQDESNTGKSLP